MLDLDPSGARSGGSGPLSREQALEMIAKTVSSALQRPRMPVCVASMTEREHVLFSEQIAPMCGALQFMEDVLRRAGFEGTAEIAEPPPTPGPETASRL